jgi:hypothetical protein
MMMNKLRELKVSLEDVKGRLLRNRVGSHKGIPRLGLSPHQVYPHGSNLNVDFITQPMERFPKFLDTSTPVCSMGSCFAVEIKKWLEKGKYNYVSTEASFAGSAEWGRVYTPKNMLQIFQYTFDEFYPAIRFSRTSQGVFDPYREGKFYATLDEAETNNATHYERSREALTTCEILVLTPGQNEAWVSKSDGFAWAKKPPPEALAEYGEEYFEIKQFSLAENIEYLTRTLEIFWANNPNAKVIFTVSPVPSSATFFDENVAARSFENKANLLLAVKAMVKNYPERTFYFPSFEIAMLSHNGNMQLDNRHVRPKVVNKIMKLFDRCFATRE